MATGLIVGESLFGVVFAAIVAATNSDAPMAVISENAWAVPLGLVVFAGAIAWLYSKTVSDARSAPVVPEDHIIPPHEITPR